MTTAAALITSGLREGNLLPVGAAPTAAEQSEALERLNRLIAGTYGTMMGEQLADWVVTQPQRTGAVAAKYPQFPLAQNLPTTVTTYPPKNVRLVWGGTVLTVYFPEAPDDGSRMAVVQGSGFGDGGEVDNVLTLDGNGRLIDGAGTVALVDPVAPQQWLYRADLGTWVTVADMALADECPFPPELDDLWVCMLAMRLAPRYGKTTATETVNTYKQMMTQFKSRYRQHQISTFKGDEIPNAWQGFGYPYGWWQ